VELVVRVVNALAERFHQWHVICGGQSGW
jgi:hypothetical protein